MSVSISGHDFKDSIVDSEERHVKCSSAEIKDQNVLLSLLLVKSVRNSCCRPRHPGRKKEVVR